VSEAQDRAPSAASRAETESQHASSLFNHASDLPHTSERSLVTVLEEVESSPTCTNIPQDGDDFRFLLFF
jgi:hypothetical protein